MTESGCTCSATNAHIFRHTHCFSDTSDQEYGRQVKYASTLLPLSLQCLEFSAIAESRPRSRNHGIGGQNGKFTEFNYKPVNSRKSAISRQNHGNPSVSGHENFSFHREIWKSPQLSRRYCDVRKETAELRHHFLL